MTRVARILLAAASAAALLAVSDARAQFQPVPPPPQAPPPQAPPPQAPPPQWQPPPPPPAGPVAMAPAAPPAPRLQLAAFTGYMVNGDVDAGSGKLVIDDAQSFGVSVWAQARPGTKVELLWIYSGYDASWNSYSLSYPSSKKFSVDTHYFQVGGVQSIRRGKVEPFVGGTLGAVWYSPDNLQAATGSLTYDLSDTWRFAFTIGGGANVFLNEKLAIRLYARMLVPVFLEGGSFYVGSGGSGIAVSGGIPAISGDFGAALVLAR